MIAIVNVFRILAGLAACCSFSMTITAKEYRVYVGTYTRDGSEGIYTMTLDSRTGKVTEPVLAAKIANPSFVSVHPNGKWLYSVSEQGGANGGRVTAFSIDPSSGVLTELNGVKSQGDGPCYVSVDATGRYVFVANYGSGSIAALPIQADGKLGEASSMVQYEGTGPNEARQKGPHAHSIRQMPKTNLVLSADLGTDKLMIFKFDPATGKLSPNQPAFLKVAPGAGPRHFAFHPNGGLIYVNGEMASNVTAFAFDPKRGTVRDLGAVSTLPADFKADTSTAETVVHPNGKFAYVSNRGHDSIAVFAVDKGNGRRLKPAGHVKSGGQTPRNFNIDPTGSWMLVGNQRTNDVHVFRIDKKTGMPSPTGQVLKVGAPVCIRFTPER